MNVQVNKQNTMRAESPTRKSQWSARQKLVRALWSTVGRMFWLCLPFARSTLIRVFGGRVGRSCRFARDVVIVIPWNLDIGDRVTVASGAILYSLGRITLGDGVVIDDCAHLCAGTHDMSDSRFPLLTPPIVIGPRCFIGLDTYIGPDVTLGADCRVWPRASVYRDFPDDVTLRGNPAQPIESDATESDT